MRDTVEEPTSTAIRERGGLGTEGGNNTDVIHQVATADTAQAVTTWTIDKTQKSVLRRSE